MTQKLISRVVYYRQNIKHQSQKSRQYLVYILIPSRFLSGSGPKRIPLVYSPNFNQLQMHNAITKITSVRATTQPAYKLLYESRTAVCAQQNRCTAPYQHLLPMRRPLRSNSTNLTPAATPLSNNQLFLGQ